MMANWVVDEKEFIQKLNAFIQKLNAVSSSPSEEVLLLAAIAKWFHYNDVVSVEVFSYKAERILFYQVGCALTGREC